MIKLKTCPYAGIICSVCNFPIGNSDTDTKELVRLIGKHEIGKHGINSSLQLRETFVKQFDIKMKDLACEINGTLLFDSEKAKNMYLKRV